MCHSLNNENKCYRKEREKSGGLPKIETHRHHSEQEKDLQIFGDVNLLPPFSFFYMPIIYTYWKGKRHSCWLTWNCGLVRLKYKKVLDRLGIDFYYSNN